MPQALQEWTQYHGWNRRDAAMAELWTRDIVAFLRARPWLGPGAAVLDFGCGFFDAGGALADRAGRVDGIDPDPYAAAVARGRCGDGSTIYTDAAELPPATYDLIFANSVFQYLDGDGGVADTLALFRRLLRPGGPGVVVLADLIPTRYSKPLDACRSLWVAWRHGVLWPMFVYLWKAAIKSNGPPLHRIDPDRIAALAAAAGFDCEVLPTNLTPSRRRYTCVLTARSSSTR